MKITDTSDLWWKTAVVYCLDDGYDVSDFLAVDPRIGDLGRFVEFVRMVEDRGMRVIIDLVVNHTSEKHPWFREARRSRDSRYHDYYVWVDEKPKSEPENVFPGEETSVWEHEEKVDRYYLHSFYRHQPDLNIANPAVRDELARVMGFWLELSVSGFRVDAVPFFLDGVSGDPHQHLRDLRRFLQRRSSEAVLLGEVNLDYEEQLAFFGGGDEASQLTMQFDFMGTQSLYLALARHDATPLARMLATRPALPPETQWANFVRNHDELTLDKLSDEECEEVFAAFAPEERMRIYGRGIVRRLPTMLEGGYAPEHVNVIAQRHDPDSLLAHIRLLVTRYRSSPEIGWGELELLDHDVPAVLAHSVRSDTGRMVALHNLSSEAAIVSIRVADEPDDAVLADLLREATTPLGPRSRVDVELEPYGYRWMRVLRPGDRRLS